MLIGIAALMGIVLVALLLLPRGFTKDRFVSQPFSEPRQQAELPLSAWVPQVAQKQASLREQQVSEESAAIASEYQRRSDAAWMEELRAKASLLLNNPAP